MTRYTPRSGLSSEQVQIMKDKFFKVKKHGATDWKNLDAFCEWAVREGYEPGMRIKRFNKDRPHSKKNSYFCFAGNNTPPAKTVQESDKKRSPTFVDVESPFCQNWRNKGLRQHICWLRTMEGIFCEELEQEHLPCRQAGGQIGSKCVLV